MRALILLISLIIAFAANSQQTQRLVVSGNDTIAGWMLHETGDSIVYTRTTKQICHRKGDTLKRKTITHYHYPKKYWGHTYEEAASNFFSIFKTVLTDTVEMAFLQNDTHYHLKLNTLLDTQSVSFVNNYDTIINGPFDQSFQLFKDEQDTTIISQRSFLKGAVDDVLWIYTYQQDSTYRKQEFHIYYEFNKSDDFWKVKTTIDGYKTVEYGSTREQDIEALIPEYYKRYTFRDSSDYWPDYAYETFYFKKYRRGKTKTYVLAPNGKHIQVDDGIIKKLIADPASGFFNFWGFGCGRASIDYSPKTYLDFTSDTLLVLDNEIDFRNYFLLKGFDCFIPSNCTFDGHLNIRYELNIDKGKLTELILKAEEEQCIIEKAYLEREVDFFLDDLVNRTFSVDYKILERKEPTAEWIIKEKKSVPRYSGTLIIKCVWPY